MTNFFFLNKVTFRFFNNVSKEIEYWKKQIRKNSTIWKKRIFEGKIDLNYDLTVQIKFSCRLEILDIIFMSTINARIDKKRLFKNKPKIYEKKDIQG